MELDEMKTLWQQMDRRLEAMGGALRLSERLARTGTLDRVRSKLRFTHFVLWYELVFGMVAALLTGSYLAGNLDELRFAVPAVVLHLIAILAIAFPARQLVALGRVDYGGPVLEIQRRLAELLVVRARANRWLLFSAPLLWALLIVVVPHGLVGLDIYRAFGVAWVTGNFAVGLVLMAAAAWASRRFPGSRFLAAFGDDLTGRKLAAASGSLEELKAFEVEA